MPTTTRDPRNDHLLSPENSALVLIDYQPSLVAGTHSIERAVLVNNIVAMAKAARLYDLPTILSTIGVTAGYQEDTIPELQEVLADVSPIDRNTVDVVGHPGIPRSGGGHRPAQDHHGRTLDRSVPRVPRARHAP